MFICNNNSSIASSVISSPKHLMINANCSLSTDRGATTYIGTQCDTGGVALDTVGKGHAAPLMTLARQVRLKQRQHRQMRLKQRQHRATEVETEAAQGN